MPKARILLGTISKNYFCWQLLTHVVVNKSFLKVGICVILSGIAIAGFGLLIKASHDSCLELARACKRVDCSRGMPVCPSDDSAQYFYAALPFVGSGIFVLVLATKDATILRGISGTEAD